MTTVAAAMIAKNEERCVIRSLEQLAAAVDEIVFVDTGSTDKTLDLVKEFASIHPRVKVFEYEWKDDFADARNYSISKVQSDWILIVDADEILYEEDIPRVRQIVSDYSAKDGVYGLYVAQVNTIGGEVKHVQHDGIMRLFPNRPELRYQGIIHEEIFYPFRYEAVQIRLLHDGYDPAAIDKLAKMKRNINLLNKKIQEDGEDPVSWMYLANEIGAYDPVKAFRYFGIARKYANDKPELLKWIAMFEKMTADNITIEKGNNHE